MMLQKSRSVYTVSTWQDKKQFKLKLNPELVSEVRASISPKEEGLLDAHMPVILSTRIADSLLDESGWEQA